MRLDRLGIDRDLQTVVVLGAGASRGSSCARKVGVAPPLDTDFFAQAQRMPSRSLNKADRDLFSFVRREFGFTDPPTLEIFFTQTAAVERFHREFNIRGRVSGQFAKHLLTLRRLIPRVFQEALGQRSCTWHERVAAALRAGDSIMSFNYDTLIDQALRDVGGKRWRPDGGYGFAIADGADRWSPPPSPGRRFQRPILLLKPHGSLNWHVDKEGRTVDLVEAYDDQSIESIVPPTWDKSDVGQWPWSEVWRSARKVLGTAKMLVVIGYSVPVTDQLSQALLRADVTKLEALVVVNPDQTARRRVVDVMTSALGPTSAVVELATLEDFASYLDRGPQESGQINVQAQLKNLRRSLGEVGEQIEALVGEQEGLEQEQRDLRQTADELESRIDDLVLPDVDDLDAKLQRLRDDVDDLDARVDSLIYSI